VQLIVYPRPVDPRRPAFLYAADDLPDCPQVRVPLRRLASLADAR
jgi:hypothetical protein